MSADFQAILEKIYDAVWGMPLIVILLGVGLYLSIGLKFKQFTKSGYWIRETFGKSSSNGSAGGGSLTAFQAACTSMAACIGTGNIVGVSGAIALGGPGAVFWMWVSGIFGMITKYAEVLLGVKFREKNANGELVGGPMYYIRNGLGKNWIWLSYIFCVLAVFASFGIGNCTSVNSITIAVSDIVMIYKPDVNISLVALISAIVVAVIVALVIVGGVKRIGVFLSKLVPFMVAAYLIAGIAVIMIKLSSVPYVIDAIIKGAFAPASVAGGLAGVSLKAAMTNGVGRGLFSNEAGLGSSSIAHASAETDSPVRQALYGIMEVFVDTIVICTITAFVILCGNGITGINYGTDAGVELTIKGMAAAIPADAATVIVSVSIVFFALSTIIGWAFYGMRCMQFAFGNKPAVIYEIMFCLFIVFSSFLSLDAVWLIAGILNALMAIPNLAALIPLSPIVFRETKAFFKEK